MKIQNRTIQHTFRNKYLKYGSTTGGTVINSSGDGSSSSVTIIDNLNSDSTYYALSANMGKVLKGLVDGNTELINQAKEELTAYVQNNYLNKKEEDTAEKLIHFLEGIDAQGISSLENITLLGDLLSNNFVEGSNGFGIYMDEEGKYHFDIDFINVRRKFTTEILEVKEANHVGGKIYSTKAGIICNKVEEYDTYYRCFFKTTDAEGRTIYNQFAVNDQAFMQTFNLSQQADGKIGNRGFWRLVIAIGTDYIDLSKTDCEANSDAPIEGDSIVQLGNRTDSSRQGALVLEPLSIKVYKGINSFVLPEPFIDLNPDSSYIKAKLINEATGEDINESLNRINSKINSIKEQSDKCFTIWMDDYTPTLENLPASDWVDDVTKYEHLQDIFYNTAKTTGGRAYRFEQIEGVYVWNEITDKDTIAALEQAQQANDLADSKRRVFVTTPTINSVYDVGDIWVNANYNDGTTIYTNDELVCKIAKTSGTAFNISHWQPTSSATTATIENLGNRITLEVSDLADKIATNTSSIQINRDAILATSKKIAYDDATGKITNISTAGLVTTADFADLFAERTTADGLVKRADISTFITTDDANNLISNATISADKINFLGKTTINGNFVVDTNGNVTMKNATVNGTINATQGNIGGLKISGNGLTNEGFNNDAYIIMRNDPNKVFCGIGGNVLPASSGARAVARFENCYAGGTTDDPYYSGFGANFAAIVSAKGARQNIALAIDEGFIQGLALRTDVLTKSCTMNKATNVAVTLSNDAQIDITLPTMNSYDDGHIIFICNQGTFGGRVWAGKNIDYGVTRDSYISQSDGNFAGVNNTKGIHRMAFVYCHHITTTISSQTFSGCWLRLF